MATAKPLKDSIDQAELLNRSRVQAAETRLLISSIRARLCRLSENSPKPEASEDPPVCRPLNPKVFPKPE